MSPGHPHHLEIGSASLSQVCFTSHDSSLSEVSGTVISIISIISQTLRWNVAEALG